MPEKLTSRLKDAFSAVFGENEWWITNWMRENIEIDDDLDDSQDKEKLLEILDSFEGKMSIDNPAFLKIINAWAGVELKGAIPDLTGPNYIVGNYAGREPQNPGEAAFLDPTLWSLFKLFEEVMNHRKGKIYAVARDSIFQGIDPRVIKSAEDHIIYAVKKPDGDYKLKSRWGRMILRGIGKSVEDDLWIAPAANTNMGGLPLIGMTTTSVRQAMEIEGANLLTLTMETDETGEKAKSIRLDEVDLPEVTTLTKDISKTDLKQLMREIYFQILTYSFAQVASYLPEEQRGQYPEPELAMLRVIRNLNGINAEGVVRVSGGFMGE